MISASVNNGDTLHWGDSVDVVVSKGPETITLPNYVGQKASDAKAALEKLGFTVKVSSQLTLDSNQDKKVASQDPVGGTEVRLRDENGIPTTITLKMYSSCSKKCITCFAKTSWYRHKESPGSCSVVPGLFSLVSQLFACSAAF